MEEQDEDLQLILEAKEDMAHRMEESPFMFYEPSGKAEEFIDAVADGEIFIVFNSSANGTGKTAMGVNTVGHILFGEDSDNPFFQHEFFKNFPYKKQGRIVSDPAVLAKNIIPEMKHWLPMERITTKNNSKSYESEWMTDNGHTFDLMTYEQSPKDFEGVTLGWAWCDEPPPDAILKALISRMRTGGVIFITATPLAGSAHLYDMFKGGSTKVQIDDGQGNIIHYERKLKMIQADIWSASKSRGVRGHLEDADILRMIAEYDEDERQARIYGKFQHLIGLVFKKWEREVHVIKPFDVNPRDYTVYEFLDPHPRNPDALIWIAIDRYGRKFVVDELWYNPDSDADLADRIKKKASNYNVVQRYADPACFVEDQHREKTLQANLSEYGLTYQKATKSRTASDRAIKDALDFRKDPAGNVIKPPVLYVFESCERTIFEMEHYRWDEWSGKTADGKNKKERPIDKDDHMIESIGRALFMDVQFMNYIPPTQNTNMQYKTGMSDTDFDPY